MAEQVTNGLLGISVVVEEERGVFQDTVSSLPLVPPCPKFVQEAKAVWHGDGDWSLLDTSQGDV